MGQGPSTTILGKVITFMKFWINNQINFYWHPVLACDSWLMTSDIGSGLRSDRRSGGGIWLTFSADLLDCLRISLRMSGLEPDRDDRERPGTGLELPLPDTLRDLGLAFCMNTGVFFLSLPVRLTTGDWGLLPGLEIKNIKSENYETLTLFGLTYLRLKT